MLTYHPTPTTEIFYHALQNSGVRVWVKREDLNHPTVSGNKWWKLKYNLAEAQRQGVCRLLTFGGAWSNHIYATAAAARELGFESIGIIRGEEVRPLNTVLSFAGRQGMRLHFISRDAYREKETTGFLETLHQQFGSFYLIPEGGTNELAVRGVAEFGSSLFAHQSFTHVCCAVGTGGTFAGLVLGKPPEVEAVGIPVLRGAQFLADDIGRWTGDKSKNWWLSYDYHGGGYAKSTADLDRFILRFGSETGVPLEQVYTGKLMWGLLDLIALGRIPAGSRVLAIHTGGIVSLNSDERPSTNSRYSSDLFP